jgi:hypothetical protein
MRWDLMVWDDCDSRALTLSGQADRSTLLDRGAQTSARPKLPVMQSRLACHWPSFTSTPLFHPLAELLSHVGCRILQASGSLGVVVLLLAGERASALPSLDNTRRERQLRRAASCRALLTRNITDSIRVPRTTSCFRCKGSEHLAVCISLQCMLSPPSHNRVIWRRTGMRYDRSASLTVIPI